MIFRDRAYIPKTVGESASTNVENEVDYVLGAGGARAKVPYLHRTPRGTLIELPSS